MAKYYLLRPYVNLKVVSFPETQLAKVANTVVGCSIKLKYKKIPSLLNADRMNVIHAYCCFNIIDHLSIVYLQK